MPTIFFKDIKHLVKNVVINPYWLGRVLKKIFRHDMEDELTYTDSIRRMGIDQIQFNQEKSELLENGVMTQVLLK